MRAVCHICGSGPASGSARAGFLCKAHEHVALMEASEFSELDKQARAISTQCDVSSISIAQAKTRLAELFVSIDDYTDAQRERAQAIFDKAVAVLNVKEEQVGKQP
jgi:hypothetical protein